MGSSNLTITSFRVETSRDSFITTSIYNPQNFLRSSGIRNRVLITSKHIACDFPFCTIRFWNNQAFIFQSCVTICQQCGDKGFSSVLIYCCKCRISAVHHYCLDVYPTKFECVSWCCEECESQVGKPSTACNPISLLHGANDAENVETVRAAQSEIRSKKNMQKKEETICLQ